MTRPADRPDDLLMALNYYAPYVSGLTKTAKVRRRGAGRARLAGHAS